MDIYRKEQHRTGEARMLNAVGWLLTELGDHPQAIDTCSQALALLEGLGHSDAKQLRVKLAGSYA